VEHVDQMMLESHVAQTARAIALLERLQSRVVRVEGLEVGKDDVALDLSRVLHPCVAGIGVHAHHLIGDDVGQIREIDRVAERLAHL